MTENYIVGRWYKTIAGSYVKYKETKSDGIFVSSESINYHNMSYLSKGANYGLASRLDNFKEVDISEFEKYLPEGHPDKIIVEIKEDYSYVESLIKLLKDV